jgi:hypothetical protein
VHKQKNLERGEKQPGDAEAYIKLEKKNECKLAEWKIKCYLIIVTSTMAIWRRVPCKPRAKDVIAISMGPTINLISIERIALE